MKIRALDGAFSQLPEEVGDVRCCQRMGTREFVCAVSICLDSAHRADGRRHNCVHKLFSREQRRTWANMKST